MLSKLLNKLVKNVSVLIMLMLRMLVLVSVKMCIV